MRWGRRETHRQGPQVTDTRGFLDKFLIPEYFDVYSEPHRMRPTMVRFPQFILHVATFYENDGVYKLRTGKQSPFRTWLKCFETNGWMRLRLGEPLPIDSDALDRFAGSGSGAAKGEESERVFEFVHPSQPDILARVEAHGEYFSLTLFCPIEIEAPLGQGVLRVAASIAGARLESSWTLPSGSTPKFPLSFLYEDVGGALFPSSDHAEKENVYQDLITAIAERFPKLTFANFRAIVCSDHVFAATPSPKPTFVHWDDQRGVAPDFCFTPTLQFLDAQWEHIRKSVYKSRDEDVIACYVQSGRAIFTSSLGSQSKPDARDELRFLLLYDSDPDETKPRAVKDDERFRLSRLVFRIVTMGTLRLAALRHLPDMRAAGAKLKEIEDRLEKAAAAQNLDERHRQMSNVIRMLDKMSRAADKEGIPIFYRTARAKYYAHRMGRLLADLDVDKIPGWQSYRQFVDRRLSSTLEYVTTLGDRVLKLWEVARTRIEFVESRVLLNLQTLATLATIFLLPASFAALVNEVEPEVRQFASAEWPHLSPVLKNVDHPAIVTFSLALVTLVSIAVLAWHWGRRN
jgi:hypothetical protein